MNIGIIGSGNIGAPLGRLWAKAGHRVLFASRHPERLASLVERAGPTALAGSAREAAEFGEVILEAVPFGNIPELPADLLSGKPVLSAANYYPERDGEIDLGGLTQSEWIARQLPGARLVKAFNMMQAKVMEALANGGGQPGLAIFFAGDDDEANRIAASLIAEARFTPIELGSLRSGALFQTDGPLYNTQFTAEEARAALDRAVKQQGPRSA
jgi:predicted dinucleotide-binding enzyme